MTDITTAREEIQAQRDALMEGTHVTHVPKFAHEACLVDRRTIAGRQHVGDFAVRAVAWAASRLGFRLWIRPQWEPLRVRAAVTQLNDATRSYPGLTASQAIAILDEALLVLKDFEASLPSPKASTPQKEAHSEALP